MLVCIGMSAGLFGSVYSIASGKSNARELQRILEEQEMENYSYKAVKESELVLMPNIENRHNEGLSIEELDEFQNVAGFELVRRKITNNSSRIHFDNNSKIPLFMNYHLIKVRYGDSWLENEENSLEWQINKAMYEADKTAFETSGYSEEEITTDIWPINTDTEESL